MRPVPDFQESPWTDVLGMASGRTPWALWERFQVPDLDDPSKLYLDRLRIISTPWFGIYLHRFNGPDSRPTLHDHPWRFLSIILRGGYDEVRPTGLRRVRFINLMRRGDVHYIERLHRTPTWSLMVVGRRLRKWGYVEPAENGYTWTAFDKHRHSDEFLAALEGQ